LPASACVAGLDAPSSVDDGACGGSGSVAAVVAFAANVAGRALAVAAPLVWFGVAAWKVRTPSKRLAWMLLGAVLLVQGLAESGPLVVWGWMFLVMLASKIKQAPLVGVGPAEQTLAMERGELMRSS
jgi:hypothetical protein